MDTRFSALGFCCSPFNVWKFWGALGFRHGLVLGVWVFWLDQGFATRISTHVDIVLGIEKVGHILVS
jgi:hypothetical protein